MLTKEQKDKNRKFITEYNRMTLGLSAKINELIKKRYGSQNKFAEVINKKESQVSKWLNGHHNFTIETIAEIAVALNEQLLFTTFDFKDFRIEYSLPKPDFKSSITNISKETVINPTLNKPKFESKDIAERTTSNIMGEVSNSNQVAFVCTNSQEENNFQLAA